LSPFVQLLLIVNTVNWDFPYKPVYFYPAPPLSIISDRISNVSWEIEILMDITTAPKELSFCITAGYLIRAVFGKINKQTVNSPFPYPLKPTCGDPSCRLQSVQIVPQ
jgi:hypothetical protein